MSPYTHRSRRRGASQRSTAKRSRARLSQELWLRTSTMAFVSGSDPGGIHSARASKSLCVHAVCCSHALPQNADTNSGREILLSFRKQPPLDRVLEKGGHELGNDPHPIRLVHRGKRDAIMHAPRLHITASVAPTDREGAASYCKAARAWVRRRDVGVSATASVDARMTASLSCKRSPSLKAASNCAPPSAESRASRVRS